MNRLLGLTVCWDYRKQSLRFTWDRHGLGNARYIYIIPLRIQVNRKSGMQLFLADSSMKPVCIDLRIEPCATTGIYDLGFPGLLSSNLIIRYFLVYSTESANMLSCHAVEEVTRKHHELITSAVLGHALIKYTVKKRKVDRTAQLSWFVIRSDRELESRCISYSYLIADKEIKQGLPLKIQQGKTITPQFLIPTGSDVRLIPTQNNLRGVIELIKE